MTLVLAVAALAVAGCFTPEDPVETASADAPAANATAAVGEDVPAADPGVTTPRDFPFNFDGKVGYWACIPNGVGSCQGSPVSTDSENTYKALEYDGNATSATVTLTWEATTPATEHMYISLFAVRSCGEGCFETSSDMWGAYGEGASPLTLDATGITLAEGEMLYLHVGTVDPTPPPPVPAWYTLEQAFSLEGVVTAVVPATPA